MNPAIKSKQIFLFRRILRTAGANKYLLSGVIALVVVAADQVTKSIIRSKIPLYKSITVVDGFFNITHVRNKGGAFSLLSGMNSRFFMIASFIALLIIIMYLIKLQKTDFPMGRVFDWLIVSLSLISGGAIGNMIDRMRFGEVIDFLDVFFKNYHWPAFNIADSSITTGVIILLIDMVFRRKEK
ncbi:MAG: signal peptidase II [Nitrospirota bacterium]